MKSWHRAADKNGWEQAENPRFSQASERHKWFLCCVNHDQDNSILGEVKECDFKALNDTWPKIKLTSTVLPYHFIRNSHQQRWFCLATWAGTTKRPCLKYFPAEKNTWIEEWKHFKKGDQCTCLSTFTLVDLRCGSFTYCKPFQKIQKVQITSQCIFIVTPNSRLVRSVPETGQKAVLINIFIKFKSN